MTKERSKIEGFQGPYRFLSNFHEASLVYRGVEYKTSEHAYQAAKVLSPENHEKVRQAETPGRAKRLGRKYEDNAEFQRFRLEIMEEILLAKFGQNQDLKEALLATGDAEIIEVNTWGDQFWGVSGGQGENWLGKLLMKTRETLRRENRWMT